MYYLHPPLQSILEAFNCPYILHHVSHCCGHQNIKDLHHTACSLVHSSLLLPFPLLLEVIILRRTLKLSTFQNFAVEQASEWKILHFPGMYMVCLLLQFNPTTLPCARAVVIFHNLKLDFLHFFPFRHCSLFKYSLFVILESTFFLVRNLVAFLTDSHVF